MLRMKDLTFSSFYTEICGGADFKTTLMENIFCNVLLVSQEYVYQVAYLCRSEVFKACL